MSLGSRMSSYSHSLIEVFIDASTAPVDVIKDEMKDKKMKKWKNERWEKKKMRRDIILVFLVQVVSKEWVGTFLIRYQGGVDVSKVDKDEVRTQVE